jgi:transposase
MALHLARAGELACVHVPEVRDEAVRDLVRARDDAVIAQRRARQQLKALLLRNDIRYVGKTSWTSAHLRWLSEMRLAHPAQQIAFQEYVDAISAATGRIGRFEQAMREEVSTWRFAPAVAALQAMRGIQFVHAMTLIAELGDLTRFESPRQLMAYLGLVPSENSSGQRRRQGSITKAGNAYARRVLVEAAWAYRHPARLTRIIALRQEALPKRVCDIAWKAQLRLCAKYRRLRARRMLETKIIVALARELSGFVWAIGQHVKPH